MSDADIVPIRIDSSGELAGLHQRCMLAADGWAEPGLKRLLQADAAHGFQAELDRSVVGFVLAFAAADEAEVLAICVSPELRSQGLGRKLLKALERSLAARGTGRLHLEARASNLSARELYAKAGFVETGRRKGYYSGTEGLPQEDAILMAKVLSAAPTTEAF